MSIFSEKIQDGSIIDVYSIAKDEQIEIEKYVFSLYGVPKNIFNETEYTNSINVRMSNEDIEQIRSIVGDDIVDDILDNKYSIINEKNIQLVLNYIAKYMKNVKTEEPIENYIKDEDIDYEDFFNDGSQIYSFNKDSRIEFDGTYYYIYNKDKYFKLTKTDSSYIDGNKIIFNNSTNNLISSDKIKYTHSFGTKNISIYLDIDLNENSCLNDKRSSVGFVDWAYHGSEFFYTPKLIQLKKNEADYVRTKVYYTYKTYHNYYSLQEESCNKKVLLNGDEIFINNNKISENIDILYYDTRYSYIRDTMKFSIGGYLYNFYYYGTYIPKKWYSNMSINKLFIFNKKLTEQEQFELQNEIKLKNIPTNKYIDFEERKIKLKNPSDVISELIDKNIRYSLVLNMENSLISKYTNEIYPIKNNNSESPNFVTIDNKTYLSISEPNNEYIEINKNISSDYNGFTISMFFKNIYSEDGNIYFFYSSNYNMYLYLNQNDLYFVLNGVSRYIGNYELYNNDKLQSISLSVGSNNINICVNDKSVYEFVTNSPLLNNPDIYLDYLFRYNDNYFSGYIKNVTVLNTYMNKFNLLKLKENIERYEI